MQSVRALGKSDHADWLSLRRGYQAFYYVDIPEATSRLTFQRLLDPAKPMKGAVGLLDARIVGLVHPPAAGA